MNKASASAMVGSDSITSRVKPVTLKLVFTASLLKVLHKSDSMENKPAGSLVVPLEKTLNGIFPSGKGDRWLATLKRAG